MAGPRVALVTGAAGGIGSAVVAALVADGCHVVAVDACEPMPGVASVPASKEDLLALEALESHGTGRVDTAVVDVRDLEALRSLVARTEAELGGVDVAVAAAGAVAGGQPLWEAPPDQLQSLLDVNLAGVWNLAVAAVPAMLRRPEPRSGRFVAIASAAAHRGLWHLAAYAASKAAVVGLVRGLAADLRGSGVTATAVSPGATRTPMLEATAALYGLAGTSSLADRHLVERLLDPAEVAAAVAWLCSPRASAVTGSVVHADGGFTA